MPDQDGRQDRNNREQPARKDAAVSPAPLKASTRTQGQSRGR